MNPPPKRIHGPLIDKEPMLDNRMHMPEKYLLGCPSIDTQHELIFALANEMVYAQQQGEDSYDLEAIFLSLKGYARTHFQHEESFMQRIGFPGIENHLREHRALVQRVTALHESFEQASSQDEKREIGGTLAVLLRTWLEHHIAEVDRELCRYLEERGCELP